VTTAVRQLLDTFSALPAAEQHEVTIEILRAATANGELSDECLLETADELFRQMDADEAKHAAS
jgi:hypothetical protein